MAEYINRTEAISEIKDIIENLSYINCMKGINPSTDDYEKCIDILNDLPSADVVSLTTFEQVCWERDLAISQLNDLGLDLGIKNTLLFRKDQALNFLYDAVLKYGDDVENIMDEFTSKVIQARPYTKQEIEATLIG